MKLGQVVLAKEQKEARTGKPPPVVGHRVDGKARALPLQFLRVDRKAGLNPNRFAQHLEPVLGGSVRSCLEFVRVDRRGNKDEAVQVQLFEGVLSEQQVPVVHGVEASAKKAYAFRVQNGRGGLTINRTGTRSART